MSKAPLSTTDPVVSANRRALLTTACGAAAAAFIGNPAVAVTGSDPIFATIETHRLSQGTFFAAVEISASMERKDSGIEEAELATAKAARTFDDATTALTDVKPSTMAGVIALLTYIDEFNRGVHFNSEHHLWSTEEYGDGNVKTVKGRVLEMPWPFWIMRNVEAALKSLAVQS